jgi:prepilin-type N-terminal cleavage/methylation domain-containing protein
MRTMIFRNQRGDTIVEVMIALAVLGSVMVGGYSIATRSINSVRVSQERGEALKLAEGQLEQLRARLNGVSTLAGAPDRFNDVFIRRSEFFATNNKFDGDEFPDPVKGFCFDVSNGASPVLFQNEPEDVANPDYPSACIQDGRYFIAIVPRYSLGEAGTGTLIISYTVTIRWDRSGGGEPQSLSLSFRTTVDGASGVGG